MFEGSGISHHDLDNCLGIAQGHPTINLLLIYSTILGHHNPSGTKFLLHKMRPLPALTFSDPTCMERALRHHLAVTLNVISCFTHTEKKCKQSMFYNTHTLEGNTQNNNLSIYQTLTVVCNNIHIRSCTQINQDDILEGATRFEKYRIKLVKSRTNKKPQKLKKKKKHCFVCL